MSKTEHELETRGIALAAQMLYEAGNMEGFQLLREEVRKRTETNSLREEALSIDCKAELNSAWISVKDRLPENFVQVLVCTNCRDLWTAEWSVDWWEGALDFEVEDVTHWQPLPEPPAAELNSEAGK